MTIKAKFAHTNIIARDWRALAKFYQQVFGCIPVLPERSLSGQWLEEACAVPGAELQGMHLRLPGHGSNGPSLEIFQYNRSVKSSETAANRPGFGHIAFAVDDVKAAKVAVIAAGGRDFGKLVTVEITDAGQLTFVYMTDPEGNIIELQRWS